MALQRRGNQAGYLAGAIAYLANNPDVVRNAGRGAGQLYRAYNDMGANQVAPRRRRAPPRRGRGQPAKRSKMSSDVKKLKKSMKKVKKDIKCSRSTHTHRHLSGGTATCAENEQKFGNADSGGLTGFETAMANFRYYNPSAPSTLITGNPSGANYMQEIVVKNIWTKVTFRNNGTTPCTVTVYVSRPKENTSTSVATVISQGLIDQRVASDNPDRESYGMLLTDLDMYKSLYVQKATTTRYLNPGQQFAMSTNTGTFCYNPADFNEHGDQYDPNATTFFTYMIRGCPAHSGSSVGTCEAVIDAVKETKYEFEYDSGGAVLRDLSYTEALPALGTAVVANAPIADLQEFASA